MRDTLSWATYPDHCQCRQQLNHSCEIQSPCLDVRSQRPPQVMVMTILIIHLIPAVFRCVILVCCRLYGNFFLTPSLFERTCFASEAYFGRMAFGFLFSFWCLTPCLWKLYMAVPCFASAAVPSKRGEESKKHSLGSAWSLSTGMTLYILYYNNTIWQSWDGEKC